MAGDNPQDVVLSEAEISETLKTLPGWELRDNWLRREFATPGWPHTIMLASTIGYLADGAWHHPDLSLGYAKVTVKLQTHRVKGITMLDVELARKIEEISTWKPAPGATLSGFPKKWTH
ncbi:MAG: 4a-hydroxytetrahydrobiopterin dehydratase [Planctomycetota bacterium]|nr:4a-hydroxytetrahydrobiopterin dehydratase [Planctomycetota bacterium]MDA1212162.1 4a-hydroxytetrahydrobiopterin dehydratase [Planctomycetota bacterium]